MLNLTVREETVRLSEVKQHGEQIFERNRFLNKKKNHTVN